MLSDNILTAITSGLWAMEPDAFREFVARARALPMPEAAREAAREDARNRRRNMGGVAIVQVHGPIVAHDSPFARVFGIPSGEAIAATVRAAAADPEVSAIVLDVDSPGGTVSGCAEAAVGIAEAASDTPIAAVSNYLMASAAYWLASQCSEVVASPSSLTGSIGVLAAHIDASGFYEAVGLTIELVFAGRFKTEGSDTEALSDPARAHMQALVDSAYGDFVRAVASGRGVSQRQVRGGMGEGRVLDARAALSEGLVDRIGTLAETVERMGRPAARSAAMRRRGESETEPTQSVAEMAEAIAKEYSRGR